MKHLFIFTISLALALCLYITTVNALTISPPLIEIDANPGEVVKKTIKIITDANTQGIYYPSVANFTARGEEGEPRFLEQSEQEEVKSYALADWIEIDQSPVGLKKNEKAEVSFTVKVPDNAEPGGHYGVIFFSTQPPTFEQGQTAIGVVGKLGSLILVRVAGDIKEQGNLLEFGASNTIYNRLPIEFTTRFGNTGNVHLKPQGEIKIFNIFGKTVAKISVNEKAGNVLPESIRKFKSTWEKKESISAKGKGFFAELKNEKNNFAFGKYKAELVLVGFKGGVKNIWVFPWRILLASIIILAFVVFVLRLLVKGYNKKIIRKYSGKS
ncbi:DUF916 domain-containing protein [Patescibacteria group bacterium]|nr:DUF916 domain-containing protein [Patescibacteria group bacterium]MBU1934152.1 DUF916 domain-containing protein [Patescibacteria group bacterium]MBU2007532.1 DUF916 domain-containing protein [Patescibacteria group bacterium]MBU2233963.1 DUF916 domain-containing protein [Patescibacteria group bacterium]MBU2264431.1 DUF916 domain-containing protein [Patescibacteria group bacterium]